MPDGHGVKLGALVGHNTDSMYTYRLHVRALLHNARRQYGFSAIPSMNHATGEVAQLGSVRYH